MELDFRKLENIAYRGFSGAEARAEKDKLIEQGFTVIEGAVTPFDARLAHNISTPTHTPKKPAQRQIEPFTGIDKARNYRAMYRAACNFHERHNPPTVKAGEDEPSQAEIDYWEEAAEDMRKTAEGFNNDPFITGLLLTIFDELEREYKVLKDAVNLT